MICTSAVSPKVVLGVAGSASEGEIPAAAATAVRETGRAEPHRRRRLRDDWASCLGRDRSHQGAAVVAPPVAQRI